MTSLASGVFLLQGDASLIEANYQPVTEEIVIETKHSISKVLPNTTGVSQEFHLGHSGMDITAPLGSKIYPLKKGKVSLIATTTTGYGRWVEVTHEDGVRSLYAHMGKIFAEEGESVDVETPIGEVGLTGHTTGPHVHLEVWTDNGKINPRVYLLSLPKQGK